MGVQGEAVAVVAGFAVDGGLGLARRPTVDGVAKDIAENQRVFAWMPGRALDKFETCPA